MRHSSGEGGGEAADKNTGNQMGTSKFNHKSPGDTAMRLFRWNVGWNGFGTVSTITFSSDHRIKNLASLSQFLFPMKRVYRTVIMILS